MKPLSLKAHINCLIKYIVILVILGLLSSCSSTTATRSTGNNQVEAYVKQSVQYMYAGRLDEALASIKKAIQINPKSADAYTVAGLIYDENNQADLAERYFKRALSIEPSNSAAQTNYANFLCRYDKPIIAEKLFLSAATNSNNRYPEVAYTNAGLCVLGIPDTDKASGYFKQALRINPKLPVPLYQLAKIQYASYRYEHAYRFLQEYEKLAQPTPKTLLLGAQLGEALEDVQLANKYKLLLAQQFPNSAEAKQVNSHLAPKQQPTVYDVRDLIKDESAY